MPAPFRGSPGDVEAWRKTAALATAGGVAAVGRAPHSLAEMVGYGLVGVRRPDAKTQGGDCRKHELLHDEPLFHSVEADR